MRMRLPLHKASKGQSLSWCRRTLIDGRVSNEEFSLIVREHAKFNEMCDKLKSKVVVVEKKKRLWGKKRHSGWQAGSAPVAFIETQHWRL